jgi:uncharacterized protein DUF5329
VNFFRQSFFILAFLLLLQARASAGESLNETIDYLLQYVANSKAVFIRNGSEHTPAEAADHIKAKYAHFKNQIKTPEDFIRLSASKSLLSGKPYLVRPRNGKETQLDLWLTEALKAHRAAIHSG